jgi:hypothetical protein
MQLRINLFFLLLIFSASAMAASQKSSLALPEKAKRWDFDISYEGYTDLMEEDERILSHAITLSPTYHFNKMLSISAFAELEYDTIGKEIIKEENSSPMGDSGFQFAHKLPITESLALINSLAEIFPTSQISKDEEYRSILSLRSRLPIPLEYNFTLLNSVGYTYIFNSVDQSPSRGTANPQWTGSYSLGLKFNFLKYFSTGVSGELRSTRFLDGVDRFKSGNTVFISAAGKMLSTKIAYSNGVVPDTVGNPAMDSLEAFQIDRYRQMLSWELSCSF